MKDLRKWLGVPQRDFATIIDVASGTLASWESGKVQELKMDTLRRMAEALGVSTALLTAYFAGDAELDVLKDAGAALQVKKEGVTPDIDPSLAMYASLVGRLSPKRRQEMTEFLLKLADDELRERGGDD
jgi:transcriptional regulator with XRE-family HTH domain